MPPKKRGKRVPIPSKAPSVAYSLEEIPKFEIFSKRSISEPRLFIMKEIEEDAKSPNGLCDKAVLQLAHLFGCYRLANLHGPCYQELVVEFYTTFERQDSGFTCRLGGRGLLVDEKVFHEVLGLEFGGVKVHVDSSLPNFDIKIFWKDISKPEANKDAKRAVALDIADDSYFYMHKFISHVVLGKQETNKITRLELALLWCAHKGKRPCIPSLLISTIQAQVDNPKKNFGFGPLITALAMHVGLEVRNQGYTALKMRKINLAPRKSEIQEPKKRKVPNPLSLGEGPSNRKDKEAATDPDIPNEGLEGLYKEIRALQTASDRRDKANREFQNLVMNRLDQHSENTRVLQEQQSHNRKESYKEFKTLKSLIMTCMCMNRDAVRDDDEEEVRRDEGVPHHGGFDLRRETDELNENAGLGVGYMDNTEDEQGESHVDPTKTALVVYEGDGIPVEARNEEILNSGDDIDSDDAREAEISGVMMAQGGYGQDVDDYVDPSHPMVFGDGDEDMEPYQIYGQSNDDSDDSENDA